MAVVLCLKQWRELNANEIYRCRLCGEPVSLGTSGKAISRPDGSFEYEHYKNECVEHIALALECGASILPKSDTTAPI